MEKAITPETLTVVLCNISRVLTPAGELLCIKYPFNHGETLAEFLLVNHSMAHLPNNTAFNCRVHIRREV